MSENYRSSPFKQGGRSPFNRPASPVSEPKEEVKVQRDPSGSPFASKSPFGAKTESSESPFGSSALSTPKVEDVSTEFEDDEAVIDSSYGEDVSPFEDDVEETPSVRPSGLGSGLGSGSLGGLGGGSLGSGSLGGLGGGSSLGGLGGGSLGGGSLGGFAAPDSNSRPAIAGGGIATGAGFKFTPMMTTAQVKEQEVNPFAPRVEKTEEQLRQEEEKARIARENSYIENQKKTKLDSFMDKLNQPLF